MLLDRRIRMNDARALQCIEAGLYEVVAVTALALAEIDHQVHFVLLCGDALAAREYGDRGLKAFPLFRDVPAAGLPVSVLDSTGSRTSAWINAPDTLTSCLGLPSMRS